MARQTYRERTEVDVDRGPAVHEQDAGFDEPAHADEVVSERTTSTAYFESLPSRINAVLFAVLLAIEGLLALRFAFAAFGANPNTGFVDFIYDLSWPFVRPFDGAFANRTWDEGIVEVNTLLAMGVWLLGYALLAVIINAVLPRVYTDGGSVRRRITHV